MSHKLWTVENISKDIIIYLSHNWRSRVNLSLLGPFCKVDNGETIALELREALAAGVVAAENFASIVSVFEIPEQPIWNYKLYHYFMISLTIILINFELWIVYNANTRNIDTVVTLSDSFSVNGIFITEKPYFNTQQPQLWKKFMSRVGSSEENRKSRLEGADCGCYDVDECAQNVDNCDYNAQDSWFFIILLVKIESFWRNLLWDLPHLTKKSQSFVCVFFVWDKKPKNHFSRICLFPIGVQDWIKNLFNRELFGLLLQKIKIDLNYFSEFLVPLGKKTPMSDITESMAHKKCFSPFYDICEEEWKKADQNLSKHTYFRWNNFWAFY